MFLNTIMAAGLLAMTGTAKATLIAYDPFNYTLGTQPGLAPTGTPTQTKGGGFTGAWGAGGAAFTAASGLAYPSLLSTNNSLKITVNAGYDQELFASPISSGTVYISYLFVPGTEASGGNNGAGNIDDGVQISPGGNGIFLGITSYDTTQGYFGVNKVVGYGDFNANLWQSATPNITYGTTNFIVIKLVNIGGNDWNGSIWVNPTAGAGTEPAADGTFVMNGGGAIGTAAFVNRNGPGNSLSFDELRYATTWSDAVSYTPPTPLNVSITSPANGSTVGNSFPIQASASVYPGTVTNVNFYDGATLLGNSTSQPYSYNATLLAGAHTLSAISYASSNPILVTATNIVSITVTDTPPLVVYEPFNYAAGQINGVAATGTGESGNWSAAGAHAQSISGSLTYTGITPANNKLDVYAGRASVNFVNPIARSGTKWISYLVDMNGNCGGTPTGVYFKNGGTGLWVGQGLIGISASTGPLFISTTDTTSTGGPQPNGIFSPQFVYNFGQTYLVVLQIQFNTGGGNDTIIAYINPTAATNTPTGYLAALTNSSPINVGTITGFGVQNAGCGDNFVDELRVGDSFGDVVGAPSPTVATTVSVTTNQVNLVSWTAYSTNGYQLQSSPDNSTWSNVGSLINGSAPNYVIDSSLAPYYQVLEYYPIIVEETVNGGFDYDTGSTPDTATYWNSVQSQPPVWINTDGHTALGCMDIAVTNTVAAGNGSEVQQNTSNAGANTVTPGNSYNFSFWAKQISSGVSYVQQYNVQWLNGATFISQTGGSFVGGNGSWAQISANNLVAPAGATTALIQIIGVTGAVEGGYGEVLVDDVSLASSSLTGGPNILTPTVQSESAFTATIKTNGVTATAATGTVLFKTNSVQLSLNAVASGMATSGGAVLTPPYTVTAIYSGDATYIGSTGTLTVNGAGPSGPGTITNSVSGNVLTLTWPAGQTWRLVGQTNSLSAGLNPSPGAWFTVPGGIDGSNSITINPANGTVFYKLVSP